MGSGDRAGILFSRGCQPPGCIVFPNIASRDVRWLEICRSWHGHQCGLQTFTSTALSVEWKGGHGEGTIAGQDLTVRGEEVCHQTRRAPPGVPRRPPRTQQRLACIC